MEVSKVDMREIGEITSEKEVCFKWDIESFRDEWLKYQHWCSPDFTYSNRQCRLSIFKIAKPNVTIKFNLVSSLPSSHYVDFRLRTRYGILSEKHSVTMRPKTSHASVYVCLRRFLSEDFFTPLHDCLTVFLRVREIKSSDQPTDECLVIKKILEDFKSLLVSGENCDVTLVVGEKKFPAHRNILCARSPVFKAMLCHDTTERSSGTVNIDDCDPDSFQDFLTYVYTASTRHINTGNVISLYTTSDKYLMGELKEECVSFMEANMSVEGFCDIAILALRHGDKQLLESLTDFFYENVQEIIETENWVTFMKDNPNDAFERFLKPSLRSR